MSVFFVIIGMMTHLDEKKSLLISLRLEMVWSRRGLTYVTGGVVLREVWGCGGGSVWDPHNLCLVGRRAPKQPSKEVQVNNLWLRLNREMFAALLIKRVTICI